MKKKPFIFLAVLLGLTGTAAADSIHSVQLTGVNGINDGYVYVSPYTITVDNTAYEAFCYDYADEVYIGQRWNAALYSLNDLGHAYFNDQSGYQFKYKEAAWLYTQAQPGNKNQWISIQYAIWDLFDPQAPSNSHSQTWLSAAAQEATHFDARNFVAVDGFRDHSGYRPQGFLIERAPTATPEPATLVLFGIGLAALALLAQRKRARRA